MADPPLEQPLVVAADLTGMAVGDGGRSQSQRRFVGVYGNTGLSWQAALVTVPPA